MEVNQLRAAAATHHPPRGHGRIDAARQQARHASADADRQARRRRAACRSSRTPGPSAPRRARSTSGSSRLTAQPRRLLMRAPSTCSISGDGIGYRLSERRAATQNDAGARSPRSARMASPSVVEIGGRAAGLREVGDAEHVSSRSRDAPPSRASGPSTSSIRPISVRTARTSRSAVAARRLLHQAVDEPRPVVALERDLLVVDDDGVHEPDVPGAGAGCWVRCCVLRAGCRVDVPVPARTAAARGGR